MIAIYLLFNLSALVQLLKTKAAPRFPWPWALLLAGVFFIGGLTPLGTLQKFFAFVALLSAVIVGSHLRPGRLPTYAAWALCAWLIADSLRLIPTPDVIITTGETFGIIRRPYVLEHPNVIATWMLLLPLGWWSLIGVALTQSRAALVGLIVAAITKLPKEFRGYALLIGLTLVGLATLIRPGTMLSRLDYWREGTQLFLARPLAGWGSDSYRTSLESMLPDARAMNTTTPRTGMNTAHNAIITLAAENGLMGLIPFGFLIVGVARAVAKTNHPAKWSLLAFAVQMLFDDLWLHPITVVVLGLMVGNCLQDARLKTAAN